jgi:hypothetical protein
MRPSVDIPTALSFERFAMSTVWKLASLLLALAVWPQQSAAQSFTGDCGLSNLSACRTTNNLVWDAGFEQALGRFLGDRQASYLYLGPLRDQAMAVLGGPPDTPVFGGNLYRFTACRAHSCMEKGAVVLTPSGQIMAVAILHTACAASPGPTRCAEKRRLAVYLHHGADRHLIVGDLSRWAEDAVAGAYQPSGLARPALEGVDVLPAGSNDKLMPNLPERASIERGQSPLPTLS